MVPTQPVNLYPGNISVQQSTCIANSTALDINFSAPNQKNDSKLHQNDIFVSQRLVRTL